MKTHHTYVKVRYAETDQMGVVHHGNYAQYLEIARIDWLEQLGISYASMEKEGVMLPVYEMQFKFIKPAKFDDTLKIETRLKEVPRIKIEFEYSIYNRQEELLTTASTVLVFMNAVTKRPMKCPDYVLEKLSL
ncbi:acyl-CoA thioesterase [Gillisia sp. M10.2A]|uniref:Acyl-CoA thioesterase n=1 Tax=Gillisia lutea TaxID=2909668 RepID=A0ABS9EDG2_9FLAO|nr:thioesterase family protein [Gillisia lutea]MCF4100917.1 acyl-CoA thioesterase [Gillisia lutea]